MNSEEEAAAVVVVASEDTEHDCLVAHLGESNHLEVLALELE